MIRTVFHPIKNLWLRWHRGAGCCDTYSLYSYLSPIISRSLRAFKEDQSGYPSVLTAEEWDKILDEMIFAFEYVVSDEEDISDKKMQNRVSIGLRLFTKYYRHLWW